ncbi:MAG: hypothetical protein VW397_08095, partial [Candidatus Margulisiibacteriota bacterium]
MSTDQRVSSLSTPIDAPIISADYDIQLLNNEGQLETAAIDYAQTGHENETVFKDLWDAIIQLLNAGQLNDDNDLLLSLIDQLMTTGVLPSEENFDQDALIQFHQWFIGMDANATYSDLMTLLEGKLLSTYANALPNSPMQQVIVFDSINEFNQYASYCQVVLPNDVITLSVFSAIPEPYDSSLHHSFGLMYHGDWRDSLLESNGVDYETAHTIFEFTELDLAAIDEWLTSLFPYGFSEVSDDEILLTLMSALQSDGFTYQVDIADQWQSMVEFLASKSGDCEEFSHLLFSAVQRIYDQLPDRDRPTLQVVSGLVGTGLNAFGHSLVMLEKNGAFFVLDPTGSKITSIDDLLLFSVFEEQINFQEYLRYALGETTIAVQLDELANFSTSSNYNDTLNEQFQAVFGSQDDFSSVISEEDKEYNLDSYDKLVKKIIALEMQRLIESGQTSGIFAIGMNELSAFLVMDYTEPLDRDELAFLQSSQTRSDINAVIEFCAQNIMPVTEDQFDFLESSQRAALVAALKEQGVITNSEYLDYSKDYGIKKTTLWNQLIDLGIITNIGMIDRDVLYNDTVIDQLQQWFQDKGGADGQQKGQLLIDLLHSRVAVFSSETAKSSDDLFENTLMQFDSLTEELLVGLTAPATPIYANPEINSNYTMISPYVIGGYNQSRNDNSLFIRVDHQKLQQSMSRFFALQNTISAYMTMIFSISDMVSSIAAKLGDDNATSASTAKQRQKIIQAFNSYSSGVNESIGTLTDIFDKTVEKTNESRYQTGLAQIDAEFADLSLQLANEFTANEYEIRSEKLKSELSQDYYNMMHDNRLSMQQAMVDVPHFGPNVMPSQFSHLFISNDDESYGDLDSMQLWAALFAHQVIDQYGQINSSVNLDDLDIMSMNYTTFNSVFQALPETSDDDKHMKQFLFDQFRFFEANRNSLGETQQSQLNAAIFDQLKRHQ